MTMTRYISFTLCALIVVCASGCGWQLRGFDELKQDVFSGSGAARDTEPTALKLVIEQRNPGLLTEVHQLARASNIQLDDEANRSLIIHREINDRRPLALTDTGVAAQFQLTLTIEYSLVNQLKKNSDESLNANELRQAVSVRRSFDFDATQIIAKTQEERALLSEMRSQLLQQILSRVKRNNIAQITQ